MRQRIICRVCDRSYVQRKNYIKVEGLPAPLCPRCLDKVRAENDVRRDNPDENGHYKQQCPRCFKMRSNDEFYSKRSIRDICQFCFRQRHRMTDAMRRRPAWEFIKSYKDNNPCLDCGITWPHYVLEFDHREPENKSHTISVMASTHWRERDWPKIAEEIAKCDLVCRNCHVIRGHGRGNRGVPRIYHPSDENITACSGISSDTSPVAPRGMTVFHEEEGAIPEPPPIQQLSLFDLD